MSEQLMRAGSRLAATLEAENAALSVLDLPRAVALLGEKQRVAAELAVAEAAPVPNAAAERMARRLQALALENKRLLERAIAAQGRVIGVVARAATASSGSYGAPRGQRPTAFALHGRV